MVTIALAKQLRPVSAGATGVGRLSLEGRSTVLSLLLLLLMTVHPWGFAQGKRIGVLYPEIREPYRGIFASIVAGVRESDVGSVAEFVLQESTEEVRIDAWLEDEAIDVLIALGRRGFDAVREHSYAVPVILLVRFWWDEARIHGVSEGSASVPIPPDSWRPCAIWPPGCAE